MLAPSVVGVIGLVILPCGDGRQAAKVMHHQLHRQEEAAWSVGPPSAAGEPVDLSLSNQRRE